MVHGTIEHRFNPVAAANAWNELYIALYNFLTSSNAQSAGVTKIAWSTGSSPFGNGFGYAEYNIDGNISGNNSWSCWKFASASAPFYMLLQVCSGAATFGASPGNPGVEQAGTAQTVAVSFAFRADGLSPWNGSTNNNGTDTKNFQVWTSGSSSGQELYVFPRSNSVVGTHVAQKQNMIPIAAPVASPILPFRCSTVIDSDNIVFMTDQGANGRNNITYFGKFTPRSGSTIPFPYVCLSNCFGNDTSPAPFIDTQLFGSLAGNTNFEGGICHPQPSSGTKSMRVGYINSFADSSLYPNMFLSGSGNYDEYPIFLFMYETSNNFGYAGYTTFIKYVYGTSLNSMTNNLSRAAFGASLGTPFSQFKVSVPWDGKTVPGTGTSRLGTQF